eukprot:8464592-Pyramimonas_sp.AAC.1
MSYTRTNGGHTPHSWESSEAATPFRHTSSTLLGYLADIDASALADGTISSLARQDPVQTATCAMGQGDSRAASWLDGTRDAASAGSHSE